MAEQNIDIKIKVDKQGNVELKSLEKGFDKIKITAKQASQAAKQLGVDISKIQSSGSINVATNDFNKLSKAMSGASAASGGATASVLELGRVVSDAPYGIRGVANNLQQLASNFAFMAKQAGGAGAALKAIGSALIGPLGILVAFQAVIAALDYFSQGSSVAESKFKDLSSEIAASTSELMILKRAMDDENVTQSQRIELVEDANRKYKNLNVSLDENGKLTDASVEAINRKIFALERLARANAIQTAIEEEMQKTITAQLEVEELLRESSFESREEFEKYLEASRKATTRSEAIELQKKQFGEYTITRGRQIGAIIEALSVLDETTDLSDKKIQDLIKIASKGMEEIRDVIDYQNKKGSSGRIAVLKQQLLDMSKIILDAYKKEALMLEENELEQMKIKQRYEREEIGRRRDMFLERQKQRYDDFMKKAKTDEERAQATKVWQDSQIQADSEYYEALSALGIKHTAEKHVKMLELERKFAQELVNSRLAQAQANQGWLDALRAGTGAGRLNRPMSAVGAEDVDSQNEAARSTMEAERAKFEHDLEVKKQNLLNEGHELMAVEQMIQGERHDFQMTQAEQEIELERNKIEAKRQINLEYASWAQGLGDIFAGIAGENKALATAALILQKGSAIANVIVDTQAANAKITANMLAEQGAFKAAAAATSLAMPALSAGFTKMAVTAGVLGKKRILKNNIGAGISIAKIAATTLQSRSAGGGGAGGGGEAGGGAPSREFDFNLVGSTGVNQLAQGVGAQFSQQPIQAYVVSSQMTSQQQLDHTIQTQASLGD